MTPRKQNKKFKNPYNLFYMIFIHEGENNFIKSCYLFNSNNEIKVKKICQKFKTWTGLISLTVTNLFYTKNYQKKKSNRMIKIKIM